MNLRWLRFRYREAEELVDSETFEPTGEGWIYALLAIRSDGYLFESHIIKESKQPEEVEVEIKKSLRAYLETMIDEIQSHPPSFDNPDEAMKGHQYQNGEEWVEATQ